MQLSHTSHVSRAPVQSAPWNPHRVINISLIYYPNNVSSGCPLLYSLFVQACKTNVVFYYHSTGITLHMRCWCDNLVAMAMGHESQHQTSPMTRFINYILQQLYCVHKRKNDLQKPYFYIFRSKFLVCVCVCGGGGGGVRLCVYSFIFQICRVGK